MTVELARRVIKAARLPGFGGNCGPAAIAINRVLFDDEGTYVVATNPAYNKKTGDDFCGHTAVAYKGHLFDATGTITKRALAAYGLISPNEKAVRGVLTSKEGHNVQLDRDHDAASIERCTRTSKRTLAVAAAVKKLRAALLKTA
jgi:hypothetical protein